MTATTKRCPGALTAAAAQELITLYEQGFSIHNLAEIGWGTVFGEERKVSQQTVARVLRFHGITLRPRGARKKVEHDA